MQWLLACKGMQDPSAGLTVQVDRIDNVKSAQSKPACLETGAMIQVCWCGMCALCLTRQIPALLFSKPNMHQSMAGRASSLVQVPLFVKEGEVIKVDTRTGDYVGRT